MFHAGGVESRKERGRKDAKKQKREEKSKSKALFLGRSDILLLFFFNFSPTAYCRLGWEKKQTINCPRKRKRGTLPPPAVPAEMNLSV